MIIIFGWEKDAEAIDIAFKSYCFNCQRESEWIHGIESEWVTFFTVKTLRFKKTNFIACADCDDDFDLDENATSKLAELKQATNSSEKKWILDGFSELIEEHQLTKKTEAQRNFIQSARKHQLKNES